MAAEGRQQIPDAEQEDARIPKVIAGRQHPGGGDMGERTAVRREGVEARGAHQAQQGDRAEQSANPLMGTWSTPEGVPPYDRIRPEHYEPAFDQAIAEPAHQRGRIGGMETIVRCREPHAAQVRCVEADVRYGAQEWGGAMQDDLTDATRWAIQTGVADPRRICIYGASYGAYAALTGVAKEPDLYRCAAGNVGVYDLPMMHTRGDTREGGEGGPTSGTG